jgi:hypothetical protein
MSEKLNESLVPEFLISAVDDRKVTLAVVLQAQEAQRGEIRLSRISDELLEDQDQRVLAPEDREEVGYLLCEAGVLAITDVFDAVHLGWNPTASAPIVLCSEGFGEVGDVLFLGIQGLSMERVH